MIPFFLILKHKKVFLVRKITAPDNGVLYAMKVLKKATLKGISKSYSKAFELWTWIILESTASIQWTLKG